MELIDRDELYRKLDSIGGCGAAKDSWADGWDCAISEAIRLLESAPVLKDNSCKNHSYYKKQKGGELDEFGQCYRSSRYAAQRNH